VEKNNLIYQDIVDHYMLMDDNREENELKDNRVELNKLKDYHRLLEYNADDKSQHLK
jgi:hypothetical protein